MKYFLSTIALFLCSYCCAQIESEVFDNELFDFKRNTIRVGIGSQNSSNFPVRYISTSSGESPGSRDFEVEYERQLSKYFSASILFKSLNYDLSIYQYNERQRQINFYYAPFNNFRRFQFKLGAGITHSTIHERNYSKFDINGLTINKSTRDDFGLIGIAELNYTLVKNISVGLKGFQQITYYNKSPFGGLVKLGYSF